MNQLRSSIFLFFLSLLMWSACSSGDTPAQANQEKLDRKEHASQVNKTSKGTIVFFGNSLTAGYGLDEGESFTDIVEKKIQELDLGYEVVNAGLSGETTAGGLNRLDWILNQDMDVFVLELGANDMLRGFDLRTTRANLDSIIVRVERQKPGVKVVLAGMKAPPNLGNQYANEFEQIYRDLAKKHDVPLIPFLLEGVAGNPKLNLQDGIHPNAEGQEVLAETVWKVLREVLG